MQVTQEMRKAVEAEAAQSAKAYQQECQRRHTAWLDRMENELKARLREILPDLTDEQFDEIYGAFSNHSYELNR